MSHYIQGNTLNDIHMLHDVMKLYDLVKTTFLWNEKPSLLQLTHIQKHS